MEYNIFYYVKLNGKKSTTLHIVSRTFSSSLPSSQDEALCGYRDTKRRDVHPVPHSNTYVRGWEFISNQLPSNKKVKVCKKCLAAMNKQMDEMF